MAGFYATNGNTSNNNSNNKKKKKGFYAYDNSSTKNDLEYDGIKFGTVTDKGLKAIESNTLDSYTPVTEEERDAIASYNAYKSRKESEAEKEKSEKRKSALLGASDEIAEKYPINLPSIPSTTDKTEATTKDQDKKQTYRNYLAKPIVDRGLPDFSPKNNPTFTGNTGNTLLKHTEEQIAEFMNKKTQPPKPKNTLLGNIGGVLLSVPYAVEKTGASALNAVEGAGDFLLASGARIIGSDMLGDVFFVPDAVSEKIRNYGGSVLESENLGEKWSENIEKRYAIHDWTRANVGTAFEGVGALLPALATEIYSAGASPMGDMWLAKYIFGKAPKLATTASKAGKVANTVTKVVSPSEIIFGLGAAGQSASEGYRTSGDLSKSLDYGAVSGTLEVAIERLSGGIAGTKFGKSILNYTTKSKPLSVVLGTGGEIFEELTSTFVDTPLRRLTVDEDAEWADFKDYYESGKQAIYLSLILGVGTYPFKNKQRKDAIQTLNVVTEELKKVAVDKSKIPSPLPENASIEDVQQRQKDLQEIARAYANQVVAETEAKENAMHNAPQSSTTANPQVKADTNSVVVGDTFKINNDTESVIKVIAIDDKFTTVEVTYKNGNTETMNFTNEYADKMATNPLYSKVDASSQVSSATETNTPPVAQTTDETVAQNVDNIPVATNDNATAETPAVVEVQTPEKAKTNTSVTNVGDTFTDTKNGDTIKIISRSETSSTVEFTDKDGNVATTELSNSVVDSLNTKPRYVKAEAVITQPATVNVETAPTTKGITSAYTNNNQKIDMRYKVVSLDDLIVSNNADGTINPKYPQEYQPRERTRQASILQVQNIANNLIPEKLGESANVSDGSPIVGSDNVVESGNGRTMALSLVYKNNPENAKKYIEFIKANAEKFGIDATNLPQNPVLVRERLTEVDRVEFVKQANESNLSAMSATELAKSDAERLSGDILNLLVANDDGNINTAENRAFVGRVISEVFSQNDLNNVVGANGMLSANGLERIRNAMFYKAYGSTELASKLSESLDNDIKNITNVLVNIAPKIVAIKNGIANGNYYDLDFSQDIVDAINYLQEAKRQSLKINDFVNQLTIGEEVSDVVKAIAYVFEQKNRGAKQATLFFNHLCDIIMSKNPKQITFANEDVKTPTKGDVFTDAVEQYNKNEEATGIELPEGIVPQRSEELGRTVDTRGIGDNLEGSTEQEPIHRESGRIGEQHRPVEEETALTGDIGTPRQSEGRKETSATDDRTDEAEVGAGELTETVVDQTKEEKREVTNNGRGKEIPDTSDAEGRGGVAEKDSRREGSNKERLARKIQEILRKSTSNRNTDSTERHGTGRLEQEETAEAFEERVRSDGYMYVKFSKTKSIAYKYAPKSEWNENANEAAETLTDLGFTVVVTEGDFLSNNKGVTSVSDQGATVGTGENLTIFISSKLGVDGMETAYHEAFHALRRNGSVKNVKHHYQMVDIISDGVNVDSESFDEFVSFLVKAYSHNVANITPKRFSEEVEEEFYAWYIGSVYAHKNEHGVDMLSFIKHFSDVNSIKSQLDAVYKQIKSETTEETPSQNEQNTPKSSENKSDEQIPTETENVATEQNISDTEVKENASTTVNNEGTKQIADFVASKLEKGKSFTSMELLKVSTVAFGGTMANNAFTVKDAYDAMELGVNKYILSMKDVSAQKMLEILELLPTQTKRTEEQVKFQQFSTPPSIAYLANYVANVNAKDTMLEPSAGIGGLAVFAKRDGATVYVNELDNRRLEVLKNMPFDRFFNENAEQINNILGGEIEPTVIVMNPPFSSSSERNIHNTKIGAKHIEQALKILAPNGRLVAIVGRGMEDGAPAFRDWWKGIKSEYNVKANIRIDGKNYSKYGTNFDIQMLVIDKNGATTHTETGSVDTLQELQQKLESIREERPNVESSRNIETNNGTEQKPSERTRTKTTPTGEDGDVGIKPVSGADSITDKGKSADMPRPSGKSDAEVLPRTDADSGRVDNQAPRNTDVVDDEQSLHGRGERGGHTELRDGGRTDISDSGQHSKQPSVDRSDRNVGVGQNDVRVQRPKRTELTDSIFEQYQTQPLKFPNTKAHPGKVSESAAMSAITPPPVTYKPNLPQDIVENGVVSDVQLEAISYAGQCHSQTLANGTTRGFFLGDGTGIGKGRTIAGIMLDNYNQGKKKAVWVTENESLMLDAKRDITALFGNSDLIMQFEGGKKADKIYGKEKAILTVSYSTLSRGYDKKGSNYEKIIDWLGEDFDGVIVFDEAHNMANATGKKGKRGGDKPSQMGLAGIALQEALPKAKIIYSSATGATEVENLRYAERLGLWGEGTAFTNGDDFVSKIKAGGIASMELIARDMKAMGVYLSRNISYDDVQYDKITHNLTSQQVKIYDELARSWQIVLQNINKALEVTNQDKDGHSRGRVLGAFWNSQQRFFNQILTSMQVPSVIADIEKQLANGKSCVIQLVSTNESAQNREMERIKSNDLELDDFDLTPKQMLMAMIENSFPVEQYEEYEDENGNKKSKPVYDSNGNKVLNREAVKQRDDLLDKLGSIKVPSSPIDMIINHFGTDLVAEKTGRSRRVIQKNGKTIEENIANKKDADVDAFQNGDKRIMIFSKAGGTGKSYHADKSAKNQQQRIHYLLEAGWQADKAVQGFGRSHRSNQVSAPIFKLVTTNLKGQMRFISTIAKRLDQLGAMTKGQRQAGSQGMFSASDNLENTLASDVLAVFYKDLLANRVEGIDNGLAIIEKLGLKDKILDEYNSIRTTAEELRDVSKFLNRILSLESYEQNTVFDGYSQRLQDATEKAMTDGTLDKGLENYKADKITLNEVQDIREDERSGAKTKYYNLTAEHKVKPIKFENIDTNNKYFVGFYRNKNTGVVRAVMQTSNTTDQYGNVTSNYKLVGQIKNEYIPQHRLYGNWKEVTVDEARTAWNEESAKLPEYRKESLHLISGVVLPVWDKLPTENVRIYRVLTSDGEMLIGRVIPEDMIDETLRRLGSARKREKIATSDLIAGVKNGDTVHLDNGWRIIQSKVSGENRIEIWGVDYEHADLVKKKGVFTERIQFSTRYFVPTDTNTEKIIDDILKISPVFRVENTKYSIESKVTDNEQTRNGLLLGDSERGRDESTRKQTQRISAFKQSIKGKTEAERKSFAKELLAEGQTEEVIEDITDSYGKSKLKYNLVKQEAYNDDMRSIVEKAKADGKEVGFFVGSAQRAMTDFKADAMISGKKVLLRYDGYFPPQTLLKHEDVHDVFDTPEMQEAKQIILDDLSEAEKKKIFSSERYKNYMSLYNDDKSKVEEEFIADIFAGMSDYTYDYIDMVVDYWDNGEIVDNFKVSEYTHSTDAGGISNEKTSTNKQRGIDRISGEGRNSSRGNTGDTEDIHNGRPTRESEADDRTKDERRRNSEGSNRYDLEKSTLRSASEDDSRRSESDGRRYLEALNNNEEDVARKLLNKQAEQNGYETVYVYHGTLSDKPFDSFKSGGAIWVTENKEYASDFAGGFSDEVMPLDHLFTESNSGIYELFVKKGNVLDLGDINTVLTSPEELLEFGNKIGFTTSEIFKCWNAGRKYERNAIWTMSATPEFANIAREHGYDSLRAIEYRGIETFGILYPNNLKSSKLITYDNDGNIIPLSQRFDTDKDSIRYSFSTTESDTEDYADKSDGTSEAWNEALEMYGAIKKGEIPSRDINVPKNRANGEPISWFARTALEAGITPNEIVDDFKREIMFGKMAHEVISDKQAEEKAVVKIKDLGFEEAVNNWNELFRDNKINKNDFVFGMVIYNQAITNKDYKLAMKLASDLTLCASESAQVLQSVRMLKKMSPDGTLYYLEKSVEKMNEDFREQLGDKFKDIEIDSELMKELFEAETTEARDEALEKIEQNIADQIPSKLLDKWNAWRYLAMLGNVRTHSRNVFGNMSNWALRRVKNLVGAVIEKTIPADQRTKSLTKSKESVAFAKEDAEVMKDILTGTGGKYEMANKIQSKRTIFKNKWLEWIRRTNFDFLEAEDWWFLKGAYQDSLAQLITARKIDVEFLKTGTSEANDLINRIRAYAINEAKVATFRQASELGNIINRTKRELSKSKNIGKKTAGILMEGVMPFTNVPINIAKQGVEYSPIGLMKGVYDTLRNVKKGKVTASEAIDALSKGLTGTAIVALGVFLRTMGWLIAEPDEDDKKKAYDKMRGHQSYALEIGDNSYTIDWLTPSSLPLFVGVELCNLANDEGTSVGDIFNALSRIADPMVELSVLQGVSDALNTAKYTEENPFVTVPTGMITSYLGQALPTLGGQVARFVDNEQRTVYIEKGEGFLTGQLKRFIQTQAKKIPFASKLLEPQIDAWGEKKTYGSDVERIIESTISPGYFSKIITTEVDNELHRLFEATGENSVYPTSDTVKSFTYKKKEYKLTAKQAREFAEVRGKKSLEYIEKLLDRDRYETWDDEKKVKKIKEKYDEAYDEAKEYIIDKYFSE